MKKRILILLLLFGLRCILGWFSILIFEPGEKIRVTGYANTLSQYATKCIIRMNRFVFLTEEVCAKYRDNKISVIGNIDTRVIDGFAGKLWLTNAKIEIKGRSQELKESRTQDRDYLNNFRESLVSVYKKFVPEPEAGLIAGIVLGYEKDIGQKLYQQMIKSGSVHIAVASGYNILLVGSVVLSLSFWFMRRPFAIWIAIAAMIFYALLAGLDPPVVRAVWMAGLMYLGQVLGRGSSSGWILTFTAWIMLLFDPSLLSSASFQLSVAAGFGLMVMEPWLSKKFADKIGDGLINLAGSIGVTSSLSTMLVTMPIIWWHFGRMSLFGILSNILILPLVPPLMVFGVGMLVSPGVFAWSTYALAHWMVLIIRFFGN